IYIIPFGYYPLKIKLNRITTGTYNIILPKSQKTLIYSEGIVQKIICIKKNNDSIDCITKGKGKRIRCGPKNPIHHLVKHK
ncbi:MAG: hypothetical protein K8R53_14010, partial [Bacteroidales bacterium]|nr:hypothetical protein [Bacteroidales bacterium]